jgi:hypothetical protein
MLLVLPLVLVGCLPTFPGAEDTDEVVSPLAPECDVFRAGSAEDTDASADTATPADTSSPTDTGPDPFADGTWYPDEDGDGFGNPEKPLEIETQPVDYVSNPCDCNDDPDNGGAEDSPTAAEAWGDGRDNNCDGVIDEADAIMGSWSGTASLVNSSVAAGACSSTETNLAGSATAQTYVGESGAAFLGSFSVSKTEGQDGSCHSTSQGDGTFQFVLSGSSASGTIDLDDPGDYITSMVCNAETSLSGSLAPDGTITLEFPVVLSCSFKGYVTGTLTLNR